VAILGIPVYKRVKRQKQTDSSQKKTSRDHKAIVWRSVSQLLDEQFHPSSQLAFKDRKLGLLVLLQQNPPFLQEEVNFEKKFRRPFREFAFNSSLVTISVCTKSDCCYISHFSNLSGKQKWKYATMD